MRIVRGIPGRLTLAALLLISLSLTACSLAQTPESTPPPDFTPRATPGGGANTIDLTTRDFVQHTLTVKRGVDVTFVVLLDSGPHILCLGKDGDCDPDLAGPPELRQDGGFSVDAGQSLTVSFESPGTYPITCSIYPSMNMVIIVT
jgi:plastocyanin